MLHRSTRPEDRLPVHEATSFEGHAVRQSYLNTGITDLYLETHETALFEAQQRLWLATGEARFADLIERTLYNSFLSGVALDGTHFFLRESVAE